ncbi:MAG: transposase [Microbacterium sp.]|uniref:transposase n=1 Tax=Microbacterium sp. TaxID=51671 RepID=UPI002621403A|nr:transposase [Microbacterium sp.]MCX6502549.1 transposase [Microbacterium sp.]
MWAVIGSLFPNAKSTGRPPVDRRAVVEATAWRYRTGAPWRDVPERFGNGNTIYKNFNRWAKRGADWTKIVTSRRREPECGEHHLDFDLRPSDDLIAHTTILSSRTPNTSREFSHTA